MVKPARCKMPGWDKLALEKRQELEKKLHYMLDCLDVRFGPWRVLDPEKIEEPSPLKGAGVYFTEQVHPHWFIVSGHDKEVPIILMVTYKPSGSMQISMLYAPLQKEPGDFNLLRSLRQETSNYQEKEKKKKGVSINIREKKSGFVPEELAHTVMTQMFPPYMTAYPHHREVILKNLKEVERILVLARLAGADKITRADVAGCGSLKADIPLLKYDPDKNTVFHQYERFSLGISNSCSSIDVRGKAVPAMDFTISLRGLNDASAKRIIADLKRMTKREKPKLPKMWKKKEKK